MIRVQLYNRAKCTAGYLNERGQVLNDLDAYWVVTDYMPVEPEAHCIYSGISYVGSKQYAAFYDKYQNFISSFIPSKDETEIVIPEKVYYVRFSLCKHSKINLFNVELEEGSLNYISGSTEAGATFTRTATGVTINPVAGAAQLEPNTQYTISTSPDVYQISLLYYRMTHTGEIYDHYEDTDFNEELNKYTFTTPSNENMCEMKVRFYTPDENHDIQVMLNLGDRPLDYQPPADVDADDRFTFSFEILQEAHATFREDLYQYMKTTLSPNLTKGDLDIIIRLMCYIFGDLQGTTYAMKNQIDPDKAEEYYLKHLCKVIGYEWEDGLTADQQRESIKMFIDIQRRRGSIWSLKNLISVFGQDKNTYYSTSDLRGVKIIECMSDDRPDRNGLYPGDIMIEIPQFSSILRDAIDNIRLIGTRIIFTYVIYCGIFKASSTFSADKEITQWFDPAYWGYDPLIKDFCSIDDVIYKLTPEEREKLNSIIGLPEGSPVENDATLNAIIRKLNKIIGLPPDYYSWPIVHRVRSAVSNFYCTIIPEKKTPYERGFVWHQPGNVNYKGFLVDNDTLQDDHTMYGYDNK